MDAALVELPPAAPELEVVQDEAHGVRNVVLPDHLRVLRIVLQVRLCDLLREALATVIVAPRQAQVLVESHR